jgi:hypothetical protein
MASTSIVIVGAAIYVLAWLLPALKDFEDGGSRHAARLRGWQAFWHALMSGWPSKGSPFSEWYLSLFYKASALSNFILAGTLLDVFLNAGHHPHPVLRTALFVCAVLNTHWLLLSKFRVGLRIGYYLWAGSFFLITAGFPTATEGPAPWTSMERFFESALIVISATAVFAGTYVGWMHFVSRTEATVTEDSERPQSQDSATELKQEIESAKKRLAEIERELRRMAWDRRFSVFWSGVLCLVAVAVAVLQVTSLTDHVPLIKPWALQLILPLFVVLLAVILVALSLRLWRSVWDVIGLISFVAIGAAPSVLVVLSSQLGLPIQYFLVALLFWLLVGVASVAGDSKDGWSRTLLALGATSTIATVFCEIGLHFPVQFRFATQPMKEVYGLSGIIDVRVALGVLFGGLCIITAIVRGFEVTLPDTPRIPIPQLPRLGASHSILAPLTDPFIIIVNGGLLAGISLFNVLFAVVVTLLLRGLNIGFELAKLIWQLLFKNNAALHLIKALLAMLVTFAVIIITFQLSPHAHEYLRSDHERMYQHLPFVVALALAVLLGATVIVLVIDGRRVMQERVIFGASLLAVLLVLAGGGVYLLAAMHIVETSGFERIGPISILGAGLMLVGVGRVTFINIAERRHARPPGVRSN